jgi:hypothetical protein
VREAQLAQYNYILVVGEKEQAEQLVNVRGPGVCVGGRRERKRERERGREGERVCVCARVCRCVCLIVSVGVRVGVGAIDGAEGGELGRCAFGRPGGLSLREGFLQPGSWGHGLAALVWGTGGLL